MDSVAMLDRSLARNGQTITINHRIAGQPQATMTTRAFVRGYRPDELTDDINQNDRKAILSPTGLAFVPQRLDQAVIGGVTCSIQAVDPIMVGDVLARIECQVRG